MGIDIVSTFPLLALFLIGAEQPVNVVAVEPAFPPIALQLPGYGLVVMLPVASNGGSTFTVPELVASPASKKLNDTYWPAAPGRTRIRLNSEVAASALAKIGI